MRVIRLEAENVKKIRAIDITPHGDMVIVSGANGQGKTSALDCIYMGMIGKKAMPDRPVRKGAEKAKIQLTLGDGREVDLTIQRTITSEGTSTLTVMDADGTKMQRPQEILDALLGKLTFDPLKFIRMDLKEQVTELRNMVPLGVDIDALNAANATDYAERTEIKKEGKRYRDEAETILLQAYVPAARVDEAAIREQLTSAGAINAKAVPAQRTKDAHLATVTGESGKAEAARKDVARLEREMAEKRKQLATAIKAAEAAQEAADAIVVPEMVDTTALADELQQAMLGNRELEKRERRTKLLERSQDAERRVAGLTRAMEDREEAKRNALASAPIPVDGLTFDESVILYHGIPLSQASTAEQIKVSVGLAMAANSELRVLRIAEGSLLDARNLEIIQAMASERDYQVWIECVDSTGKIGIVIEDGRVVATNE